MEKNTEFLSVKCVICSHMVEYGVIYDKFTNDEVNIWFFYVLSSCLNNQLQLY